MGLFQKGQPRPPGSGRKKGQANRKTIERRIAEAQGLKERLDSIESNEMPLDFMLRIMRDPAQARAPGRAASGRART